ncbi:hypothetical protein CDAR_527311 [Caerostris darwini]|uniref:Uncharacterized protein n=1 Tax=Caerostris darwini TaxID=1538125 RepID=A0AAV4WJG1_9ARAC|nr:hypothetical protein CDAR_527311 [Caerostris darwini]
MSCLVSGQISHRFDLNVYLFVFSNRQMHLYSFRLAIYPRTCKFRSHLRSFILSGCRDDSPHPMNNSWRGRVVYDWALCSPTTRNRILLYVVDPSLERDSDQNQPKCQKGPWWST